MAIDLYRDCPGGERKKIKHCNCRELVDVLEKIERSLSGGQKRAALGLIERALEQHGLRSCLLYQQATTLLQLGELEKFGECVRTLVAHSPENSSALGLDAIAGVARDDLDDALQRFQDALDLSGDAIPGSIATACLLISQRLAAMGPAAFLAASAYAFVNAVYQQGNEQATEWVMKLQTMEDIPMVLKGVRLHFSEAPEGVEWSAAWQEVRDAAKIGRFRFARKQVESLLERHPDTPTLLHAAAVIDGALVDHESCARHWHAYARTLDAASPAAHEAEAIGQIVDREIHDSSIPIVRWACDVADLEALTEHLLSEPRATVVDTDMRRLVPDEDTPPPKSAFWIMDRTKLPDDIGEQVQRDEVPSLLTQLMVFGRETDREPRIEAVLARDQQFDDTVAAIREMLGSWLRDDPRTENVGSIASEEAFFTLRWVLPPSVPNERMESLKEEEIRHRLLEQWPRRPHPGLGGKTPTEATEDPALRLALAGAVVVLECYTENAQWSFDFNEVRRSLGVPDWETIRLQSTDSVLELTPCRMAYIDFSTANGAQLQEAYQQALFSQARTAMQRVCEEIMSHDDIPDRRLRLAACSQMAHTTESLEETIRWTERGADEARQQNLSPAEFLLTQLNARILMRDVQQVQRLADHILQQHGQEPGVSEALYQILMRYGLIQPQTPGGAPAGSPPGPPAAAEETPGIWTPDQGTPSAPPSPPAQQEEGKSKLWLPGMD